MKTRLDETNNIRKLMGLPNLKEQGKDKGDTDHFLRHKTVVDYDATVPKTMEWKECSADIKNHDGPVLLMFSRSWCGPCKKIKKITDKSEDFQKWADSNNVIGLNLWCENKHWMDDTEGCRSTKCSDGKTLQEDLEKTTEEFGGELGTGMASETGKWQSVPKIFLTDSSFNKKNEIKTDFNMDNFIKSLGEAL